MITSPDQHKPGNRKGALAATVVVVIFFVAFMTTPSTTKLGYGFTIGAGLILVAIWVGDWALRKNGMRRKD